MSDSASIPSALLNTAILDYDALLGIARRRVRCHALAADIVQEMVAKLLQGEPRALPETEGRAYLRVATRNLAYSVLRRQARESKTIVQGDLPESAIDETPDAERVVIGRQEVAILVRAIAGLPPRCREVLVLHKFRGQSYSDIAQQLGISPNTVMVHMANALKHLRRHRSDAAGPGKAPRP